ncbi:MAG: hypothetical protein KC419_10020 [Anaerolineales bacterium]|nr:hypothetical protein [Anaerolineales bacterium]MCA9928805.1 hypothetical protein [Anaerolineales bacterium]
MLAQINTLRQEHQAIGRGIALMQKFDPDYTINGFCEDFDEWLAALDAQTIEMHEADFVDAYSQQFTGIAMF